MSAWAPAAASGPSAARLRSSCSRDAWEAERNPIRASPPASWPRPSRCGSGIWAIVSATASSAPDLAARARPEAMRIVGALDARHDRLCNGAQHLALCLVHRLPPSRPRPA